MTKAHYGGIWYIALFNPQKITKLNKNVVNECRLGILPSGKHIFFAFHFCRVTSEIESTKKSQYVSFLNEVRWLHMVMITSSNGNIFCVTGPLFEEFTGPRWFPLTKASDANFDVFFDLCPNKRLSKQWWGWWFETQSRSLWRHCDVKGWGWFSRWGDMCYHIKMEVPVVRWE